MEVGIRAVRGPDWTWGHQDEGEGNVGTVVEIGRSGSTTSPDKTVVVQWDGGMRTNYRVGYQGAFDLRIIDNAPSGVKHPNIVCDGCTQGEIMGIHWKCENCPDYDLCTECYMSDKHDTSHMFQRFENASSIGVLVGPRSGETKVPLKGIFIGARVVRGHDWDWGNQDGGEGKTGRVTDIRGWDNESGRSVANVTWTTGSTNVYRLGHKGKVDLRYIEPASGGSYYREHLPILGQGLEHVLVGALANRLLGPPSPLTFSVGDKVKVHKDVETLKTLQSGHGGWNPRMAQYIGKVGTVHRVTERGDIRVQYEGCNHRWTFNPSALTKRNCFSVGDFVRVIHDTDKVKEYQKGHGEWIEVMKSALGKVGKVVKIYSDGDLRVSITGQTWTLNPLSVQLVPQTSIDHDNTNTELSREDHANPLTSLLSTLKDPSCQDDGTLDVVREAAQGHLETVRDYLLKHPEKVDCKSKCRTCLQVASHQGHAEIVHLLLSLGASLSLTDDDGDTALHYSAFGNQPDIMDFLLKAGADRNATNKGSCTALHVAVNKQHVHCVRVLLRYKSNVNIQDSYGDTALHDAIGKDNMDITDMLCSVPGLDFTLRNNRGFNVLHHAALKGNSLATEKLLLRSRQLVDVKKDDGFAALHLSCLNGHRAVAETLLVQGQAEVDLRNNRRQTPLILAVSQGHCSLVELCVSLRADVHAEDEDGDTALHLALMKRSSIAVSDVNELEAPTIYGIYAMLVGRVGVQHPVAIAIACYLIQEGCSLEKQNKKGKTPLDLVPDPTLQDILKKYVTQRSFSAEATAVPSGSGERASPLFPADLLGNYQSLPSSLPGSSSDTDVDTRPVSTPLRSQRQSRASASSHSHPSSSSDLDSVERLVPVECMVCSELADQNVKFEPCMHRIACEDCSSRMKKCLKCGLSITRRLTQDGRIIACKSRQPSAERLRYLESKIAEIEEAHCCSICMERRRNVVFLCGHSACDKCSHTLKICHMCRKTITKKINIY
ncbi:hypothetical protein ONE63_001749 [Megalurothrips usitatus]|uniref:RING-type E3 ubiquitin transferase n=1 Tax=Megalurothrips usitatus TaxID=439358 RepID=A0AAV7XGI9_9NEOP|nr:hypothetical protein ONE63_001749 [Megalurothrips usitatus]